MFGPDLATIYRENRVSVIRFLRSRGYSAADCEDIAQETFLKVSSKLADFRGDCSVKTWLCLSAFRIAMDLRRNEKRRREILAENPQSESDSPENTDLVRDLLRTLPPAPRKVLRALVTGEETDFTDNAFAKHESIGRAAAVSYLTP